MKARASPSSSKSRAPIPRGMSRSARSTIRAIASRRQGLEDDDLAPRQERAVQLERRVLRGRTDEDDVARLDVGKKHVLLRPIEAVDLVEEQDRALALARARAPRVLEDLAHLLDPRGDRRVGQKVRGRLRRDQARERRLAHAGRPPENERRDAILGDGAPEEPVGADDLVGTLDLVERPRPHAVGQRRVGRRDARGGGGAGVVFEEGRHPAFSSDRRHSSEQTGTSRRLLLRGEGDAPVDPGSADGVPDHLRLPESPPARAAGRGCVDCMNARRKIRSPRRTVSSRNEDEEKEDELAHQAPDRMLEIWSWIFSIWGMSG